MEREVRAAVESGGDFRAGYRVIRPDGAVRWIEARGRVDLNGKEQARQMLGVSIDATERQQAEWEARELRGELAHAGRVTLLGQLSSALAHELSQPLGAILRNAEAAELMLKDSSPDLEEIRAIVRDIHADDRRAGAVIDRLRSLLKRQDLMLEAIDLDEVINEAMSLLQADAISRGIELKAEVPESLPGVRGDRVHLIQVLLNLALNAMDAIDQEDSGERKAVLSATAAESDAIEVSVCDTGPGLSPEILDHLFEPFFTTKSHGIGMGLPVSQTIVEAHRGVLEARNLADCGAEFRFTIPIHAESLSPS